MNFNNVHEVDMDFLVKARHSLYPHMSKKKIYEAISRGEIEILKHIILYKTFYSDDGRIDMVITDMGSFDVSSRFYKACIPGDFIYTLNVGNPRIEAGQSGSEREFVHLITRDCNISNDLIPYINFPDSKGICSEYFPNRNGKTLITKEFLLSRYGNSYDFSNGVQIILDSVCEHSMDIFYHPHFRIMCMYTGQYSFDTNFQHLFKGMHVFVIRDSQGRFIDIFSYENYTVADELYRYCVKPWANGNLPRYSMRKETLWDLI